MEAKLGEHIKYEKTVTKQLQDELKVIQTHQNELGKAETDDKKALERKFEEIQASLKKEEANIVERSRELNIQCKTILKPFETQLKLLTKCDSLEQMKDEVYTISLKIDRLTEEITQISKKIDSSTHDIPVEVSEESMSKGLRDIYQTSTQCSISSSQHDLEEDRPIGPLDVEEDRALNISHLQVALPEDLLAPGSQLLSGLSSILDSCRLISIYVTKSLDSDTVAGYGKHINVIQSLEDPQKANRIIPLQVNEEKISVDLSPIIPLKFVKDITDGQFPIFKRKLEKLVNSWRKTLP